jgi:hypothetical protein
MVTGGLLLAIPATTLAQTCLQQEYNTVNKQKLNCTANDVRVAGVSSVTQTDGVTPLGTCIQGSQFSFIATFNVVTTANATNAGGRDNIGLYFQTDPSKPDALTGTCVDNIIYKSHFCSGSSGPLCGTVANASDYQEFDPAPDNCGDTSSGVNPNINDRILITNFNCTTTNTAPCPQDPTKQCLTMPNCTSWQVPGSSTLCVASGPNYPYPLNNSGQAEAIPGSPSKCNCAVITLPIQPVNPKPIALKACNTPNTTATPTFTFDTNNPPGTASPSTCDAGAEGTGVATYTVSLDNPNVSGAFGDIIVDQICDSAYGQVYPVPVSAGGPGGGTCKAGSTGQAITSTTCTALDVALGTSGKCTFTAPSIGELATVQNIVTISGHSGVNSSVTFSTQTNQVTVNSTDAPTAATATKSFNATVAACATVRYNVEVDNTSGADEQETLSALSDSSFGSITSVHDNVLATTCSVSQTIAPGGNYKCTFDAQFCTASNDSGLDANGCFSHSNTVNTVTLVGDESADAPFNATSNQLTVKECIAAQ